MKLTVNNFRGIEAAEIEISPIALVTGKNGAGKTSIAQAAAAVMTGNAAPVIGFKKKDAGQLVRDGQKSGKASIDGGKITFPRGTSSGEGPRGSAVAAGVDHPLDMRPAESAKYLSDLLEATPSRDDLVSGLPDIDAPVIAKIWQMIESRGWDAAHAQAKETGTKRKGQWEMITGVNYGEKRAENWVPAEFESGVPDREKLTEKMTTAKQAVSKLMASRAVSEELLRQNQAQADKQADAEERLADMESEHADLIKLRDEAHKRLAEAQNKYDGLPQPGAKESSVPCPECGSHLVVISPSELKAANMEGPSDEENEKRRNAINSGSLRLQECRKELSSIEADISRTSHEIHNTNRTIQDAKDAAEWLETANTEGATDEQIEAAQHDVDDISYKLSLIESIEKAESMAASIIQSKLIASALASDGVRQTVLVSRLSEANSGMAKICKAANYPAIEITPELEFTYNGRAFNLLSESEAYRVRVVSQLYLSKQDGSHLVVIDRADLLDKSGRNGLFKAVKNTGIPALICMTLDDPLPLPAAVGRSYWVEGGQCGAA